MFSSNLTKFFACSALIFLLFSGCRFASNSGDADSPAVPEELQSEIPFSTKEPEQYQAEIVVTANETERRTFVARSGARVRYDFNYGAKNQLTQLQTDKNYRIAPALKIYHEYADGISVPPDDWSKFLTSQWLSDKQPANFEKLESVDNLTKYRVRLGESNLSEVFVYIDETNNLPVKQEFYSGGAPNALLYTVELRNLKLATDESLFTVPADFRRVSDEEFSNLVWQWQNKDKK